MWVLSVLYLGLCNWKLCMYMQVIESLQKQGSAFFVKKDGETTVRRK